MVLGTLLTGGATQANAQYAPILSSLASQALLPGEAGRAESVNLTALLPPDYASKFYTYPGSLTTPPCSQVVTWFVFEDAVALSDDQLELLRDVQTSQVRPSDTSRSGSSRSSCRSAAAAAARLGG